MAILTICIAQAKIVKTSIYVNNAKSKHKVESVAKGVRGVTNAIYSTKTKTLTVSYDNKKTNVTKIKKTLNNAGYKTNKATGHTNQKGNNNKQQPKGNEGNNHSQQGFNNHNSNNEHNNNHNNNNNNHNNNHNVNGNNGHNGSSRR